MAAAKEILDTLNTSFYRIEQIWSATYTMSKLQANSTNDTLTQVQVSDDDEMMMNAPSNKRCCVHEDTASRMPEPSGDKRQCQLQEGLIDGSSFSSSSLSTSTTVHPMGKWLSQSPLHPRQSLNGSQLSKDQEEECGDSYKNITSLGSMPSFPAILHSILRRPDLQDIVAWMPDGKSWRIVRPREFEIKVLPNYFNHSKYSSFLRQAHAWGFRSGEPNPRLTDKYHSYYHELFLRDAPHVIKIMELQQQ